MINNNNYGGDILDENNNNNEQINMNENNHENNHENNEKENVVDFNDKTEVGIDEEGTAAAPAGFKIFLVIGWISAALTLLISPIFAIAAIVFGIISNSQIRGSGNALIVAGIVAAAVNFVIGYLFV